MAVKETISALDVMRDAPVIPVIVLHDVEGLEHEEVASILGCHVGTSKSQLHKARARLREMLAADGITAASLQDG